PVLCPVSSILLRSASLRFSLLFNHFSSLLADFFFFFNDTATTEIYTLSLHDALPISPTSTTLGSWRRIDRSAAAKVSPAFSCTRSEEHTSELQSRFDLVCRLLLEKKKKKKK